MSDESNLLDGIDLPTPGELDAAAHAAAFDDAPRVAREVLAHIAARIRDGVTAGVFEREGTAPMSDQYACSVEDCTLTHRAANMVSRALVDRGWPACPTPARAGAAVDRGTGWRVKLVPRVERSAVALRRNTP